jgi:hypothetical protein
MSNDPWASKREELQKHSNLRLNALLCEHDSWDEKKIAVREKWLAEWISKEWPGPDASFSNGP